MDRLCLLLFVAFKGILAQAQQCPNNLLHIQRSTSGDCYYGGFGQANRMNYVNAVAECEAQGMKLASVRSQEEQDWVRSQYQNENWDQVWLSAREENGVWRWTEGDIMQYSNWVFGQPDSENELCMVMNKYSGSTDADAYRWQDEMCNQENNFICKYSQEDACASSPCSNNRTCTVTDDGFTCECISGRVGGTCGPCELGEPFTGDSGEIVSCGEGSDPEACPDGYECTTGTADRVCCPRHRETSTLGTGRPTHDPTRPTGRPTPPPPDSASSLKAVIWIIIPILFLLM